ncbi:transposable element Tcb2 transposase [Trichonephila clavipes]|nr:transposable element Tcb2 transposase [Trichonephila clavipes]
MANNQSVRRHLDAFTRGRIIGKLEEGRSVTSVAAEFRIAHSIVSRYWKQFQTTGTAIRGSVVVVHEEPNPQMTGTLSYRPEETGGRQREKSLDTRHRRLDDRYRILPWPEDCTVVVYESRISLSSDSHRILIWRERGIRNHPSNIIERDRYGGRGVLVWGGIMLGSRTDLPEKAGQLLGRIDRQYSSFRTAKTIIIKFEDRYIVLSANRNRRTTAQQVANQFLAASGKQISRKTVARRLREGGLYARRPVVCVPLTRQHRTARFQWCREHHNWTEQDWACVLFSDESRFSLSSDCRRQLIWRERGTSYRPENIQEKDRYPTCSIMVWSGIMINGRTCLHVVANGTMTG